MFGPLKTLLFLAVLWLPLSFFVWFYFAQLFVVPIAWLSSTILEWWMPAVFTGIEQTRHVLSFITALPIDPAQLVGMDLSQGRPAVVVDVNPMIYGFCIPVLTGLVMATPLSSARRALQIGALCNDARIERGAIGFQRDIIERLKRFGIVEIGTHRVRRLAALVKDIEWQRIGPPVGAGPPKQAT